MINRIDEVMMDPAASWWLKGCLAGAVKRDPIDVANDLSVLRELLTDWCKKMDEVAERFLNYVPLDDEIP